MEYTRRAATKLVLTGAGLAFAPQPARARSNGEWAARLQAAYDAHVAEIQANQRPTAEMVRPSGAVSPQRPDQPARKQAPKTKQKTKQKKGS